MLENNSKKLRLNKETIRALSGTEMQGIAGGRGPVGSGASHGCSCTCNCPKSDVCPKVAPVAMF
jgi:natural product precursor